MLRTPRSGAASTVRRSAFVPARWPAATGRPRRRAQRPLPSMITATDDATSGRSSSGSGRMRASVRMRERSLTLLSDLHDLGFLALQEVVDLVHVVVRELLDAPLRRTLLVVAHVAVLHELLEVPHRVAPHVAD